MNWMYSCKRVAELLSQSMDEPLGRFVTLRMRIHLSMCGDCRNVEQQMLVVKTLSADLFSSNSMMDSEVAQDDGASGQGWARTGP